MHAFPAALAHAVRAVVPLLSKSQMHPPSEPFRVRVRDEDINIPHRVYYRTSDVLECADHPGTEGAIALCLGTRHHDGYFREKCLDRLIKVEEEWAVPFVVQLIGEYVLPIVQIIERNLPGLNMTLYANYVSANQRHFETIGRRAVSYWDVYYRRQYPKLQDYPAFQLHKRLSHA